MLDIDDVRKILKDAGYRPRLDHQTADGQFSISGFDSKRGVSIVYDYLNTHLKNATVVVLVRRSSKYIWYSLYDTLEEAITESKQLSGDPPKSKENRKIPKWRTATRAGIEVGDHYAITRPCILLTAQTMGVCQISSTGTILLSEVAKPDADTFFFVRCLDIRDREVYVITNDGVKFLIALTRGRVCKIVNSNQLFMSGTYPLDLSMISIEDMAFVNKAIKVWVKAL